MSAVDSLLNRIEAEFDAAKARIERFQHAKVEEHQQRQERLKTFEATCDRLRAVWKPRLDALAARFGERANVTPTVEPSLRQATFRFQSQVARIVLAFSATTDADVRRLILRYDLQILPILMQFKNSDELAMPLDAVDEAAIGAWIDDRILDFVKTYLAVHENKNYLKYLKDYLVVDPIAGVELPTYAAAATCEWNGRTHYFIGEETCREFRAKHGIAD